MNNITDMYDFDSVSLEPIEGDPERCYVVFKFNNIEVMRNKILINEENASIVAESIGNFLV